MELAILKVVLVFFSCHLGIFEVVHVYIFKVFEVLGPYVVVIVVNIHIILIHFELVLKRQKFFLLLVQILILLLVFVLKFLVPLLFYMSFLIIQMINKRIVLELCLYLVLEIHGQQLVFVTCFQKRLEKKLLLLLEF